MYNQKNQQFSQHDQPRVWPILGEWPQTYPLSQKIPDEKSLTLQILNQPSQVHRTLSFDSHACQRESQPLLATEPAQKDRGDRSFDSRYDRGLLQVEGNLKAQKVYSSSALYEQELPISNRLRAKLHKLLKFQGGSEGPTQQFKYVVKWGGQFD